MSTCNLQELRINKNLTQEEVGKLTDTTKDYISLLERGKRNPSDKMKEKLAKIYGVDIIHIFLATQRTKRSTNKNFKTKRFNN